LIVLRKRIAELEAENSELKSRLASSNRAETRAIPIPAPRAIANTEVRLWLNKVQYRFQKALIDIPALPSSPMPKGPPPSLTTKSSPDSGKTPTVIPGIVPPPVTARRTLTASSSNTMAIMAELTANGLTIQILTEIFNLQKNFNLTKFGEPTEFSENLCMTFFC
jgi:hypothetical protein